MSKFVSITVEVLAADAKFAEYLRRADIKQAKKGGAFVGNYEVAPDEFRKYGIVLPKGGMIIPDAEPETLHQIVQGLREAEAAKRRREQETAEAVRNAAEQKIMEARSKLLPAVHAVYNLLEKNAGDAWRLQALEYGKDEPSNFYHAERVKQFETAHKLGLLELLPITDTTLVFDWTAEDVARLTQIVQKWFEASSQRREFLWNLFVKANGIFTKTEEEKSAYAGKSFGRAMATAHTSHYSEGKWDEWIEVMYYVGGEKLANTEYEWLKSRSGEVPSPRGFYRVPNAINVVKLVIFPREDDVLEVWGKTGNSRRGVNPTGTLYRGKPENCDVHPGNRWAWKWTLNGTEFTARYLDADYFKNWNDPVRRAERALEQAGIKPEKGEVEALAEAYRQLGK